MYFSNDFHSFTQYLHSSIGGGGIAGKKTNRLKHNSRLTWKNSGTYQRSVSSDQSASSALLTLTPISEYQI